MAVMVGEDLARLAKYVVRRRVELGWKTREAFAAASGLSVRTLGDIERARRKVGDASIAAVEDALGWRPGAFDAILADRDPELVEPPATPVAKKSDALAALVGDDPDLRTIADGLRAIAELTEGERVHMVTLLKALRGMANPGAQQDGQSNSGGNRHAG
jgi:transcriptional regulator with XRE-family HTH domain